MKCIKGTQNKLPHARITKEITKETIAKENNRIFDSVLFEIAYSCIFVWYVAKGIHDIVETNVASCKDTP